MFIDLPNPSIVMVKNRDVGAYVNSDNILKIKKEYFDFDDIMYSLAYMLKPEMVCPYCGQPIRKKHLTIDHMYPRDYGGISIPNNLLPCCKRCNSDKGSLDFYEFNRLIAKDLSRGAFEREKHKILMIKDKKRYKKGIFLPDEWIEYVNPKDLKIREYYKSLDLFGSYMPKKLVSNMAYIEEYNHMRRGVVTDRYGYIIDGYVWYVAAVRSGKIKKIPATVVKNVELI